MTEISTKKARSKLPQRREPYWQKLKKGAALGVRIGATGESWIAKYIDAGGRRHLKAMPAALDWDGAQAAAEGWIATIAKTPGRVTRKVTVKAALERYAKDLAGTGRADTAREVRSRFKTTVEEDALAGAVLEDLTREQFLAWRDRLREGREPRSVNRQVRAVVAGLNHVVTECGFAANPAAWAVKPLRDDTEEEGETAVFLNAEQRAALIAKAAPAAADFFRGLELTGARPKELAAATVRDLVNGALRLAHRKGRPAKLRVRLTVLDADGRPFFESIARGKIGAAPLFTEDGEQPWRRHKWAESFRAAVTAANETLEPAQRIPPQAGAYAFRHARISELLQLHGIDPLTVASQTGTSIGVISSTYFKFIKTAFAEKLAAVKATG